MKWSPPNPSHLRSWLAELPEVRHYRDSMWRSQWLEIIGSRRRWFLWWFGIKHPTSLMALSRG